MEQRTIKFKAKRLDNGKWVEGDLYHNVRGFDTCIGQQEEDDVYVYPVDLSTICQFTGLTNNNGVPIFEGDIVKFGSNAEVIFKNGAFLAKFGEYVECPLYELVKSEGSVMVVGNKFDRKEEK